MKILLLLIFIIPVKVIGQTTLCIYKTNSRKVVKLQEGSDFLIKDKDGWRKAKDCIMDVKSQSLVFVYKPNPLSTISNDTIYLRDILNIYYYNHYDFFLSGPAGDSIELLINIFRKDRFPRWQKHVYNILDLSLK